MINNAMRDYIEKINNKDENYNKIVFKMKGVDNMRITIKKILSIVAIFVVVIFVGTISTEIYAKIQWNIEFKEYQNRQVGETKGSLQEAKESGYAEVLDMEYLTQDGISCKVDSLLITDDCFDANITFKFSDDVIVDSKSFSYGYVVYDENKNIYTISSRMHIGSKEKRDKITPFMLQDIKGDYNKNDIYAELFSDSSNVGNIEADKEQKIITSNFTIRARDSFPKSKKIYIRIFDLGYTMLEFENIDGKMKLKNTEDFKLSDAEWRFEIDVPDKFYDRQTTELKLANDIPNFEATKITLTEAGLVIYFKSEKYLELISAGKDMNGNEFREATRNMLNITDGEGNVYQDIGGGTTSTEGEYKMTLDAGKKDLEKGIYLNFNVDGNQYKSELIEK